MNEEESFGWAPTVSPNTMQKEDHWRQQFDNSVNAVSFGFVATAILISMFLVMAIFERFLRPSSSSTSSTSNSSSPSGAPRRGDLEAQNGKLGYPSPLRSGVQKPVRKLNNTLAADRAGIHPDAVLSCSGITVIMSVYSKGVSVLMPGEDIPTFIAHPVPIPCPPERTQWPPQQHYKSSLKSIHQTTNPALNASTSR